VAFKLTHFNFVDYKVWGNVRGLLQVPSKAEDNSQTRGNASGDSPTQGPMDEAVKEFSE